MIYWLALSLVDGIGLATKHSLLKRFGTPEKIFGEKISKKEFPTLKGDVDLSNKRDFYLKSAERISAFCEKENVNVITFADEIYPKLLRGINQAPLLLYCKGNAEILSSRGVAIVGTREPNVNGEKDAGEIAYGLAQNGFVIVSGLARGVDSVAHNSALDANGTTIAVMATGINNITPGSNIELAKKIIEKNGAIITEQPPGKLAFAPNFVLRNRIIAGLSECSIVICAPEKSGALRTAEFARQQGKKILVSPGYRSDEKYDGSNRLLSEKNVVPALKLDEILSFLNGVQKIEQISIFDTVKPKENIRKHQISPLPQEQEALLSFLSKEPISLEKLSEKSGVDILQISEILFDMELNGTVVQDFSGNYRSA
jgi:DNA processing protein